MDKLVIDIETKNTFAEVGQDNFDALKVSVIGAYSYSRDEFFCFEEHQFAEFGEMFKNADSVIGFSINRFDVPILKRYFNFDVYSVPRFDILDEIEFSLGQRVGLDLLAKINLGKGKTGYGLEAVKLYRQGKIEELKNYCLNDVKITKELYDLAKNRGYLLVPKKKSDEILKVNFDFSLV